MEKKISALSELKSILLSFLVMFALTYVAIDVFGHLYFNLNKIYMAGIMTSSMLILRAFNMRKMLAAKTFWTLLSSGVVLTAVLFVAIRTQFGVGNDQFLRSMIPHHSSAIVMCEETTLTNPEIIELCDAIVETQKEEISIMQNLLEKN